MKRPTGSNSLMAVARAPGNRFLSIRTLRNLVLLMVPVLILVSLHGSSSRWRELQEEIDRRDAMHETEVEKLEQRIAKAQQAQVKCSDQNKDAMEREKQRYIQRLAKQDVELRARDESLRKLQKSIAEVEKESKDLSKEKEKLQVSLSEKQSELVTKAEELQELKDESIAALKASRDRAGVLRRGLQGSAALLAEKNVLIKQLNVTLFQALYHMEPDQRLAAAQGVSNLNLPLKERKATQARLASSELNLEAALENAAQGYQEARKEHARLAQEFVNTTRREKERLEKEREHEEMMKELEAKKKAEEAAGQPTAAMSEGLKSTAKEEMLREAEEKERKAAKGAKAKLAAERKKPTKVTPDPLALAKNIKPLDLITEQKEFEEHKRAELKEKLQDGVQDEDGFLSRSGRLGAWAAEEEEDNIGDLESIGGDNETPEQKKAREEQEAARRKRVDRAMQKEVQRQEQAKYWAKYHNKKKEERKKASAEVDAGEEAEAEADAEDGGASVGDGGGADGEDEAGGAP